MKKLLAVITLIAAFVAQAFCEDADSHKVWELEDALRLALERNSQLRAANLGVQVADGRLLQAGNNPQPDSLNRGRRLRRERRETWFQFRANDHWFGTDRRVRR